MVGSIFRFAFNAVTRWSLDSAENFSRIEKSQAKYVIVGADPCRDNVIPHLSSL